MVLEGELLEGVVRLLDSTTTSTGEAILTYQLGEAIG